MNIASTQFTLKYNSFEIYLSGCDGICSNKCHNKELWNFNLGRDYKESLPEIKEKIRSFDSLIKNIWVLGGEPLLQKTEDLIYLLEELKSENKEIWLWTRFELGDVPIEVVKLCDYIKVGKFVEELLVDNNEYYGINLSTSNQKIIKVGEL